MTGPMTLDPERLRRALALEAERVMDGWLVAGRYVDQRDGCGCPDRLYRGVTCKHELRARLDSLDADILEALRELAR